MKICPVCRKGNLKNNFHFEKERKPTYYAQCNNPKCKNKSKEIVTSFTEILKRV